MSLGKMPQVVAVDSLVVPRALLMIFFGPSSEPLSPKSITKIGCSGVKFSLRHDLIPFKGGLIVRINPGKTETNKLMKTKKRRLDAEETRFC